LYRAVDLSMKKKSIPEELQLDPTEVNSFAISSSLDSIFLRRVISEISFIWLSKKSTSVSA
jgi:hypothetical protein